MSTAQQEEKYMRMTTFPVKKLVGELAVPSIVSMLISSVYNIVDTFFVGHLDTQSTAALGIVFSYMAFIQAMAFFFGQGAGNFISRSLGSRNVKGAEQMAAVGFLSSVLTGVVVAIVGFIFMDPLLDFLGSTPTVKPFAAGYFRWILVGTPFIMGCFSLNNLMRQQGNALMAMIGIASGAVLNIVLDPVLIYWAGMGVEGAGLATAVSQAVGFVIMLSLTGKRGGIRIHPSLFKPRWHHYVEIAAGGLPSLLRQGLGAIAAICFNQVARNYGDEALAAFSVVSRVMMFAASAMIGYGQGFQPVCGFNYGARLYDRVRKAFWHSTRVSTLYCTLLAIAGYVFAPQIIALFRADDPAVIRIGAQVLRYQCMVFPLIGFIVMTNMYLQNIRKVVPAIVSAALRNGLAFIPALYIGQAVLGFTGVELAQSISDVVSFLISVPLCLTALRSMGKDSSRIA
ncbi:MAG: MATE family efflux transporter [Bacteroidales bacterium]|nr:MATE family efflux transporter [Bacteroidales bacterium]MBQ9712424.1 MATE family efflux transporter [Bacteroidales bacterium]